MTVTDHTHPITPDMPVYPGTEPPVIHPADPVGATVFDNHLAFFRAGVVVIENLANLGPLVGRTFTFSCLPLASENGDGSPVRAVAMGHGAATL